MAVGTREMQSDTTVQPVRTARFGHAEHAVLGFLLAIALTLFVVQGFCVSGSCMEPHLFTGERVLAWKLAYAARDPHRGDIVIFHYPRDPRQTYVKRVIGLPGEEVAMHNGQITIDGQRLPEPYRVKVAHGDMQPQLVPHDEYFVMGDNRDVSDDSRYWGDLPRRQIIGQAVACYWPPRHCQILK